MHPKLAADIGDTTAIAVKAALADVERFVESPPFRVILDELWSIPPHRRPAFVASVILDQEERALRGVRVPDDLIVQRSTFSDGRPTLFCVTKLLPAHLQWKKVTVTYDNP